MGCAPTDRRGKPKRLLAPVMGIFTDLVVVRRRKGIPGDRTTAQPGLDHLVRHSLDQAQPQADQVGLTPSRDDAVEGALRVRAGEVPAAGAAMVELAL